MVKLTIKVDVLIENFLLLLVVSKHISVICSIFLSSFKKIQDNNNNNSNILLSTQKFTSVGVKFKLYKNKSAGHL